MKRIAIASFLVIAACADLPDGNLRPFDAGRQRSDDPVELDAGNNNNTSKRDTGVVAGPCAAATLCGDCIYKIGCGWCPSSNSCIAGDHSASCDSFSISPAVCSPSGAPDSGTTPEVMDDPARTCAAISSCDTCTSTPNCGFCPSTNSCVVGSFDGPSSGACNDWQYFPSECSGSSAPVESCSGASDCGDCSSRSGCGWCDSAQTCVPGTSSGPDRGSCFRWVGDASQCTSCAPQWSCDSCMLENGCGWCEEKAACEPGSWNGPSSGFCSSWVTDAWSCASNNPPPPPTGQGCSAASDCSDCASRSGCGWCDSTSTCTEGSSSGPTYGSCSNWDYVPSACSGTSTPPPAPTSNCDSYSCSDCASRPGCGWCNDSASCEGGNGTGPWQGSCWDWDYSPSACAGSGPTPTPSPDAGVPDSGRNDAGTPVPPPPPDPCASLNSCGDCVTAASCGFCWDTWSCEGGSSSGPSSGSCLDWSWTSNDCVVTPPPPPPDPCASLNSCGDCTAAAGCGYCWDNWACESGSGNGPTSGTCSDWSWFASDCTAQPPPPPPDPCAVEWACYDCTITAGCGWCEDTYSCLSGDSTGPTNVFCSAWDYFSSTCP